VSGVRVLALAAAGVVFVRSPTYLAETIADAVDAKLLEVRDERRFWRTVQRAYELRESEMPELQARVARKYCRNLEVWGVLPELRRRYRLALVYSGPGVILDCWRREYPIESLFDLVVEATPQGLLPRDPALYELIAGRAGVPIEQCGVVESTLAGFDAVTAAGARAYRFGTVYGMRRWLATNERADPPAQFG
jgi:FMN phosphatase YigB (HAD superfamily)